MKKSLLIVLWGCASTPSSTEDSPAESEIGIPTQVSPPPMQLRLADLSGVRNGRWMTRELAVGGLVQKEAFEDLAKGGLDTVVDLRRAEEMEWDARASAEGEGLVYVHMPVGGLEDIDSEWLATFDKILKGDGSILVHCASGNRVGAAFALHAHHYRGATTEEALGIGKRHGLSGLEDELKTRWSDRSQD